MSNTKEMVQKAIQDATNKVLDKAYIEGQKAERTAIIEALDKEIANGGNLETLRCIITK